MKIGYFTTTFPYKDRFNDRDFFEKYTYGGAQIVAYYLANSMAQRKHEIKVFTTSVNSKDLIEEYDNIKIYRYGSKFKIEKRNVPRKLFQDPLNHPLDLIHAHSSIPIAVFAAIRCANKKKVPFIFTYHGDSQETYGSFFHRTIISFYNKHLLNKVLSRADVIISPSEYHIDESRFLGNFRDKVVVIPNGINVSDFDIQYSKEECRAKLGLPLNKNEILFVGNLAPYKRPDVLLKSLPIILGKIPDTKLVFVGSGIMKSELELLSKKLGVEKHIKFAGFVEEGLKPLYYRASDIFVLPSNTTEVFPIVLLEASASGLPIVVSDLDTFSCIIEDGYNGIVTKRGDEKNLADAIIYLLDNEETREKMGKNGRKKVEVYSWERIAEETEKVYKQLV